VLTAAIAEHKRIGRETDESEARGANDRAIPRVPGTKRTR
jgi:hypothetical protein